MCSFRISVLFSLMCVLALIVSKGITFLYAGMAGVVMQGRYVGLALPNPNNQAFSNKLEVLQYSTR